MSDKFQVDVEETLDRYDEAHRAWTTESAMWPSMSVHAQWKETRTELLDRLRSLLEENEALNRIIGAFEEQHKENLEALQQLREELEQVRNLADERETLIGDYAIEHIRLNEQLEQVKKERDEAIRKLTR